ATLCRTWWRWTRRAAPPASLASSARGLFALRILRSFLLKKRKKSLFNNSSNLQTWILVDSFDQLFC
ncbi:unnamed protein product, partial [Heterosigma akashiwo]